mmetsp:Transcript_20422/g.28638  ORF Transcript_20422/g.28638 Transcript_20422/m.28638 type:complete len:140 (-) Transcript_20422:148-567(-)
MSDFSVATLLFNIFILLADCGLVFVVVYFLALFSDLETDSISPIDMCRHLNLFVYPEMIGHAVLTVLFLVTGRWFLFFLNLPLVAWHAYRYNLRTHMLDATQIYRDLSKETKVLFVKLGYYMICFCIYLFFLIYNIVEQ